jgi:hypothetical protein
MQIVVSSLGYVLNHYPQLIHDDYANSGLPHLFVYSLGFIMANMVLVAFGDKRLLSMFACQS